MLAGFSWGLGWERVVLAAHLVECSVEKGQCAGRRGRDGGGPTEMLRRQGWLQGDLHVWKVCCENSGFSPRVASLCSWEGNEASGELQCCAGILGCSSPQLSRKGGSFSGE